MRGPEGVPDVAGGKLPQPYGPSPTEKASGYRYRRFRDNDSIRMLTLAPGRPDDRLRGTLEAVDIDDTGCYEAVSYVWAEPGPPDCEYEILIGGDEGERTLKLRGGSIFAALRRLRLPDRERRVWADQVCINQEDKAERAQQVQFMNKIYKNASHVLVWLGLDEKSEAHSAFSLVRSLADMFGNASGMDRSAFKQELERKVAEDGKALHDLTSRVWFKRGWIVQEIGTEAAATMFWGDAEMDWNTLYGVCESLTDHHHLRSKWDIKTSEIKFLFQRFIEPDATSYHANRFNFLYELHRARELKFTDDRDRIFAFLGHYSLRSGYFPNQELASLVPDYGIPVERVYVDMAKRALRGSQGDCALIALAAVQHPAGSLAFRDDADPATPGGSRLPSWVPDWRTYQGFILSEPINPHRAHGASAPKLRVEEGSDVLEICGVEVDAVEACAAGPLRNKEFHNDKRMLQSLWNGVCGRGGFNLDDKYRDGQAAFYAFMQTLANGCVQTAGREGTPYEEIPASRWLGQAAMYLATTRGEPGTISPELASLAAEAELRGEKEEWSRCANGASKNRTFARTAGGYYVLGPAVMEPGDVICVLFGGKLPFCLRPVGGRYLLVGECYVHGLMDGEAIDMMDRKERSERKFELV